MPLNRLDSLTTAEFDALVAALAADSKVDMLLSGTGFPGETTCLIAVNPQAELLIDTRTSREEMERFAFSSPDPTIGFLSYHWGFHKLGLKYRKHSDFPMGHLKKYDAIYRFDRGEAGVTLSSCSGHGPYNISLLTSSLASPRISNERPGELSAPYISLDRTDYCQKVVETLDYIRQGYIYQLNLSIKFSQYCTETQFIDDFSRLSQRHPAPFYAWYHSGQYRLLSTSPELFLRVRQGHVLSRPIKGTLQFQHYDDSLPDRLRSSPKEDAELSMIVDMVRNDISMNCQYGSVKVENHKAITVVDNLLQMHSDVVGSLRPDRTCLDLFLDAFPGASVTGCPKQMAMTIIDRLEPHPRSIYCGSFFVIYDRNNMDSSIAIRTAYHNTVSGEMSYFAGSGIVVDSIPEAEYEETMAKAAKFLNLGHIKTEDCN
jgi:para-aminobenzoate synthetase component I